MPNEKTIREVLNEILSANGILKVDSGNIMPLEHDSVVYTYDVSGNVETAVFKTGGVAEGTTVATLTYVYDGGNLASIERS